MDVREHPRVLVTFEADDGLRGIITGVLGDVAEVAYLGDAGDPDRVAELARADVLLASVPDEELHEDEWSAVSGARFLQIVSAGVEHVPFARLPRTLLVAGNVGAYAEPMAEHIVAMILALAKRLGPAHDELRRGVFDQDRPSRELRGTTCAILGLGGVGRATLPLLRALGMRVLAVTSRGVTEADVDFIGTLDDLETVLRGADVVVLSLPLTRHTRGLIGSRELAWMRPDAMLINVARGPIVHEEALYRHLVDHPDFMAGLEVWWDEPFTDGRLRVGHPFLELPNVLGCPHNSGIVPGWLEVGVRRAAENVRLFLLGRDFAGLARPEDYVTA
jgi:phosphoglycerate dehydrogenase-like enzyme